MYTVSDALKAVLDHVPIPGSERVPLVESLGRVLLESIVVPEDVPAFSKATMDGFAISADDVAGIGGLVPPSGLLRLRVVDSIVAGRVSSRRLNSQEAMQIMTGAPIPQNCSCVVPVERVQVDVPDPEWVGVPVSQMSSGLNILTAGAIARRGEVLLKGGIHLRPAQIGAMAELGIVDVLVSRRPTVSIVSTGSELVPSGASPGPGQIRNSIQPMLTAQSLTAGALPQVLGICDDDPEHLRLKILEGLQADVLVMTGGVSVGIRDLVPEQLLLAGVKRVFHGVWMKPGKPVWFGVFRSDSHTCLVFGLPGNPVSSLACFELFVRPALGRFLGLADPVPCTAVLSQRCQVRGDRPVYQPVVLSGGNGTLEAQPVSWTNSADLLAMVTANGFACLKPEHGAYDEGDTVEVLPWGIRNW